MDTEHKIIEHYFTPAMKNPLNVLGSGDDGAVSQLPENHQQVISIDTLNEGVHFFANVSPTDLAYKALAVSLSDLAAMGATPFAALVSLSLPKTNADWLQAFSESLTQTCETFQFDIIGGDLTQGPMSVSTVLLGHVPNDCYITRANAKAGDKIFVTGVLGDAAAALQQAKQGQQPHHHLHAKLDRPTPRLAAGLALQGIANAAIDLSDGLVTDLQKILTASQVGATMYTERLPLSTVIQEQFTHEQALQFALNGGDDYELCFTVPADRLDALKKALPKISCDIQCIGEITEALDLTILGADNKPFKCEREGYEHFSE